MSDASDSSERRGAPSVVDPRDTELPVIDVEQRYEDRRLLGAGGMGEVRACLDRVIGREIAMKVIGTPGADAGATDSPGGAGDLRWRFVREARVQGQLEHPAVVPVYDLGRGLDGAERFTMKRVSGMTLVGVLSGLRAGRRELQERFSRRRLLGAFQQICLCVDYAHSRGVLHRDLKPANVMFGDFGEVYLLDWGLASVRHEQDAARPIEVERTAPGQAMVLGTPGYMAPEQIVGEKLDERCDVYALGALLFEILTWQPLHKGEIQELVLSTVHGANARASERAPERDVPPELEAICVQATSMEREARPASARQLHDAIERFLEGHRDLELRRDMAAHHLAQARAHAERVLQAPGGAPEDRSAALGEIGRALVLDPDGKAAHELLARLLAEPPKELPVDAARAMAEDRAQEARRTAALVAVLFSSAAVIGALFAYLSDIKSLAPLLVILMATGLVAVAGFVGSTLRMASPVLGIVTTLLACAAVATTASLQGPLVMTPGLAVAVTVLSMSLPNLASYRPWFLFFGCLAVAIPAGLEIFGVLPSSYVYDAGNWKIISRVADPPPERAYPVGLLIACLATIVVPGIFVWRLADEAASLERRVRLQAWQLRQLVPEARIGK